VSITKGKIKQAETFGIIGANKLRRKVGGETGEVEVDTYGIQEPMEQKTGYDKVGDPIPSKHDARMASDSDFRVYHRGCFAKHALTHFFQLKMRFYSFHSTDCAQI
jgi:hypothetical protein